MPRGYVSMFADVSGFAVYIASLVANGLTAGCGGPNYCPTASVTRQARSGGASSSGDWGEKVAAPVGAGGTEQEESPIDGG